MKRGWTNWPQGRHHSARNCVRVALACGVWLAMSYGAWAQTENLLDRISNEKMSRYETQLTKDISSALNRYISHSQYVLSVKVIWNRGILPVVADPGLQPQKQKLPGFPIFVGSPGSAAMEENTPPFVRMVVKILLDETLPEYYERFVRKITPIVARFDVARGDQVIILKETFPVKTKEESPPTLPEKELMKQLGESPSSQFQGPPQMPLQPSGASGQGIPRPNPIEAAQVAYEEGRTTDALRIVQSGFQRAASNQERALYLGMEGSILYTMQNHEGARASWQRALVFDPTNIDVQRVMHFMEQKKGLPAP